ncbi:virion structural protein [Pseudomonas phage 201phi2-1]|uniref:Virion structural protein n=1 Tax=Pseudomonas phage 201phi2-1 TaxID=198110 RepID=B3FJ77_BP201|nr:virion structural protein [Pseudomonas phage 201phi2-1]ABY63044.1 virion structural protein [Pseudomonas phage 201phi2-1]
MYELVRARYRRDRRDGRWAEADLADEPIGTLSANYGDIYLYIEYPGAGSPVLKALHWSNVEYTLNGVDPMLTVQQWLTSIGNKTLPFDAQLPNEKLRLVKYAQAWHCGYDIQAAPANGHIDQDISVHYKDDLVLTHPKFKPQVIRDNCLISVNGYFHLTDWTVNGVRIIDGNKTVLRSNDNQIGLYSFETIGKLKFVPITDEMIIASSEDTPLWDATYLKLPSDVDIKDKTVLLVTGGYLNVLSDVYERVNDNTWRLSFGRMMFLNRYIQSVKDMDLSSLGLESDPDSETLFNAQQLKDDSVIRAYLKLSQSFFVIVDSPTFFQSFEPVQYLNEPGRFIDGKQEQLPMVGAYGKMLDYHIIKEPGMAKSQLAPTVEQLYVYCATMNQRNNYDAHHRPWLQQKAVNGGRYPAQPVKNETAYFRIIGVEG